MLMNIKTIVEVDIELLEVLESESKANVINTLSDWLSTEMFTDEERAQIQEAIDNSITV